jgi:hypothetical protein
MNPSRAIALAEESQRASVNAVEPSQLLETATDVLLQGLHLLFQLDDQAYSRIAPAPFNASVGSHFRRVLERLLCLVNGFRPGEIDYDAPERNARLERRVAYASVACCDLLRAFKKLTKDTLNKDCVVVCSGVNEGDSSSPVQSTLGRELEYCIGHALHHFDIIRLICDSMHIRVPLEFGDAGAARKVLSGLVAH